METTTYLNAGNPKAEASAEERTTPQWQVRVYDKHGTEVPDSACDFDKGVEAVTQARARWLMAAERFGHRVNVVTPGGVAYRMQPEMAGRVGWTRLGF